MAKTTKLRKNPKNQKIVDLTKAKTYTIDSLRVKPTKTKTWFSDGTTQTTIYKKEKT